MAVTSVPELGYNHVVEFGIKLWSKLLTPFYYFFLGATDMNHKTQAGITQWARQRKLLSK